MDKLHGARQGRVVGLSLNNRWRITNMALFIEREEAILRHSMAPPIIRRNYTALTERKSTCRASGDAVQYRHSEVHERERGTAAVRWEWRDQME